jgi:hypothetical protein
MARFMERQFNGDFEHVKAKKARFQNTSTKTSKPLSGSQKAYVDITLADAKAYVAAQTKSKTPLLMGNRQVPPQRQGRKPARTLQHQNSDRCSSFTPLVCFGPFCFDDRC